MWYFETATDAGAEDATYKLLPGGPTNGVRVRIEGYKTPEVIYEPGGPIRLTTYIINVQNFINISSCYFDLDVTFL